MKIYLAARYSRREEMKRYRDVLVDHGHEVTSRWIDFADMPEAFEWYDPSLHGSDDSGHAAPEYREGIAAADIEDVIRADGIMMFTPAGTRGGVFVEWGAAIARHSFTEDMNQIKVRLGSPEFVIPSYRLIVVGPRVNIFQNYPGTELFNSYLRPEDNFCDALVTLD